LKLLILCLEKVAEIKTQGKKLLIEELPDLEDAPESSDVGVDVSSIKLEEIKEAVARNKSDEQAPTSVYTKTDESQKESGGLFSNFDKIKSDQFDSLD
jgi:hypothetical protein